MECFKKHLWAVILAALLALGINVLALPESIFIAIYIDTWADTVKRERAIKEVEKYVSGEDVMGFALFATNATGELYGYTIHWAEQWTEKEEKLTDAGVAQLNTKLNIADVTIVPHDNWRQALIEFGLFPPKLPSSKTNVVVTSSGSTTTTSTSTTTTTTTAEEKERRR